MTLTEFMNERYDNRPDKGNMFGVGISDKEFRQFVIDYLLGEDWCVVDPLGREQINEIALYEILHKYSKQYRNEEYKASRVARRREKMADVISPKEFAEQMQKRADEISDKEWCHGEMDDLMVKVLNELGYEEGTKIFEETPKWYA